jgi:hypothetical protein
MNNQEQQFANPGISHAEQRPINNDPREQHGSSSPTLNPDPRAQPHWPGQPPFQAGPPQRAHHPWRWVGLSAILLVVIFGGLFTASALLTSTVTETKSFAVGAGPTLALNNGNGSVEIVNGPAGQISVVAHKHIFLGDASQLPIHYKLSDDQKTLTISVDDGTGFCLFCFGAGSVDFEVTVPSQANLDVHTGNGSLSATGISGQISLDSGNGSIAANNLSGPLTLRTGNGSITAAQANASGSSTLKTGNGSITFSGSLERHGTYLFTTGNGSIDLTLPGTADVQIFASTGNGSVDSDFSYGANGTVGSPPYAQVTLHTGNGSIHLHKGN